MSKPVCWVIDNYEYRKCNHPTREFRMPVFLHGHSYHSEENIGRLNYVMQLPVLRTIHNVFNRAFRAKAHDDLDYSDIHYCPPISPEEVWRLEKDRASQLGFEELMVAITDHDKIAGCHELMEQLPDMAHRTTISEELSIVYDEQVIHLGIHGLPRAESDTIHKNLQEMAHKHDHDGIFELLHEKGAMVIFNHPLWQLKWRGDFDNALKGFLKRYLWAIHAFEFNGLRRRQENDRVIDLARRYQIPLIGGGDRHTPIPSVVFTASRESETYDEFIQEVKSGRAVVICTNDYFINLGWKMFVRILQYVQTYRKIVFYKNIPLTSYPVPDRMFLDRAADLSRWILRVLNKFDLVR